MYLVKDFKKILKDLEPFVTRADKKGRLWLHNGNNEKRKMDAIKVKDGTLFKLRPREAWANWLICVVLQHITGDEITFSDSEHGDGYIWNKTKGEVIITEHVAAMDFPNTTIPTGEERVIWAIEKKIKKGKCCHQKTKIFCPTHSNEKRQNQKVIRKYFLPLQS